MAVPADRRRASTEDHGTRPRRRRRQRRPCKPTTGWTGTRLTRPRPRPPRRPRNAAPTSRRTSRVPRAPAASSRALDRCRPTTRAVVPSTLTATSPAVVPSRIYHTYPTRVVPTYLSNKKIIEWILNFATCTTKTRNFSSTVSRTRIIKPLTENWTNTQWAWIFGGGGVRTGVGLSCLVQKPSFYSKNGTKKPVRSVTTKLIISWDLQLKNITILLLAHLWSTHILKMEN